MSEPAQVDQTIGELRQSLAGSVLVPADAGYDQARRAFNLLVDRRPAVIFFIPRGSPCAASGQASSANPSE